MAPGNRNSRTVLVSSLFSSRLLIFDASARAPNGWFGHHLSKIRSERVIDHGARKQELTHRPGVVAVQFPAVDLRRQRPSPEWLVRPPLVEDQIGTRNRSWRPETGTHAPSWCRRCSVPGC